jgi:hypothetical protein
MDIQLKSREINGCLMLVLWLFPLCLFFIVMHWCWNLLIILFWDGIALLLTGLFQLMRQGLLKIFRYGIPCHPIKLFGMTLLMECFQLEVPIIWFWSW